MIKEFKKLNLGVKRLTFIGSFLTFLLVKALIDGFEDFWYFSDDFYILVFAFTFIGYWICVLIVLWIIEGFKKK